MADRPISAESAPHLGMRAHKRRTVARVLYRARIVAMIDGMRSVPICCEHCHDGDGASAFPYYGVAPHQCFYALGLQPGQSRELPESEWPENFVLDPEAGPATGFPRCGTYTHCLHCGAGI